LYYVVLAEINEAGYSSIDIIVNDTVVPNSVQAGLSYTSAGYRNITFVPGDLYPGVYTISFDMSFTTGNKKFGVAQAHDKFGIAQTQDSTNLGSATLTFSVVPAHEESAAQTSPHRKSNTTLILAIALIAAGVVITASLIIARHILRRRSQVKTVTTIRPVSKTLDPIAAL